METAKKYSIVFQGLKNGVHEFGFKVDKGLFEAEGNGEIKGGDCDVRVRMDKTETMLELTVGIRGEGVVECDRCLEDCPVPIDYEGVLAVKFSDEVRDYDGEIMWISRAEGEVDLTQYIYESIVLSLPYRRVHPDGGCNPDMLARFTIADTQEDGGDETYEEK